MATITAPLTIEQFLQLPEEQTWRCELVEGEIVPMGNASRRHEWVKGNFIRHLVAYSLQHQIGQVLSETMYKIKASESRTPDVSFQLARTLSGDPDKLFPVARRSGWPIPSTAPCGLTMATAFPGS